MINREKVINGLRSIKTYLASQAIETTDSFAREGFIESQKVIDDAIAMLKEQDAVEARKKNDGKPQPWTTWWYVCGDCGQEIDYHDRFCRWCGRSVKWDE